MEKTRITEGYLRELICEEKNEETKAWMMTSLDLGTEKHVAEKENRRLEKENDALYYRLRFMCKCKCHLEEYERVTI